MQTFSCPSCGHIFSPGKKTIAARAIRVGAKVIYQDQLYKVIQMERLPMNRPKTRIFFQDEKTGKVGCDTFPYNMLFEIDEQNCILLKYNYSQ